MDSHVLRVKPYSNLDHIDMNGVINDTLPNILLASELSHVRVQLRFQVRT